LKKLDKYIPGASSFIDTRIFDDEKQALVEIASSLILNSEKKKKLQEASQKGKRKQFSKKTKQMTLIKQNFRCASCKNRLEFPDFDHIDGNSSNNDISNCKALCPNCHARKTRKKS